MKGILALLLAGLLVSCATPPPEPEAARGKPSATVGAGKPAAAGPIQSRLLGRSIKPIPEKALDVSTRCSFKDVAGGSGSMDLLVSKAEVQRFVAEVSIPKQGVCRFDIKNFAQTGKLPHVVLTDASSGCVVRMWEQEEAITVAFNGCKANCQGDAFSYLWPILVDGRSGHCS